MFEKIFLYTAQYIRNRMNLVVGSRMMIQKFFDICWGVVLMYYRWNICRILCTISQSYHIFVCRHSIENKMKKKKVIDLHVPDYR